MVTSIMPAAQSICRIISGHTSLWGRRTGICSIMVAADGQRLTLGDTTLTLYLTPGHTLGTISTLIPVKDNGKPHLAAEWGGTGFNWTRNRATYITPDRPDQFW